MVGISGGVVTHFCSDQAAKGTDCDAAGQRTTDLRSKKFTDVFFRILSIAGVGVCLISDNVCSFCIDPAGKAVRFNLNGVEEFGQGIGNLFCVGSAFAQGKNGRP